MPDRTPGPIRFPDVAGPVAEATQPPPFEEIVVRARRHRRRQVLAATAATAGVLALAVTGVVLTVGDRDAAPPVVNHPTPVPSGSAGPRTTDAPAPDADSIVSAGHLASFAVGTDGALLTVWQTCTDAELATCYSAWQVQTPDATHRGLATGDNPSAYAAGDAFVVKAWNRTGVVVDRDGAVSPLTVGDTGTVAAGDLLLPGGKSRLLVVDPATRRAWPLPLPDGPHFWGAGAIGSDGTTWVNTLVGDQVQVWWTNDPADTSSWHHHTLPSRRPGSDLPGYLAAAGDHVATMSGSDGATILPLVRFAVTTDGGASWVDLGPGDLPFDTVDAMAATSGGTLYVVTAGGEHLFRSTDPTWTRFAEVPNPDHVDELVPGGDRVLARGGSQENPVLLALDDAGHSAPVP